MASHLSLLSFFSISLLLLLSTTASSPPPSSAAGFAPPPLQANLLASILSNLGFQELAMAVPSLSSPLLSQWSGPLTVFAPSDDSVRSCAACSATRLLREHLVPGLFSQIYLSNLPFGSKIETASPGRCLTVTVAVAGSNKTFVEGVEISRPDLFNDGQIVIHGLQGFVTPLSPLSCIQPPKPDLNLSSSPAIAGDQTGSAIARLMMRDAIVRLRDGGYSILSLAFRVKYAELASLHNMTVFALDDPTIFAGGHTYVTNVRFHVVPDRLLMLADLMKLPEGTILPTLVHGQHLVVTSAATAVGFGIRINYVPIKNPDVLYNTRIVVHGIFLPFPHLNEADMVTPGDTTAAEDGIFDSPPLWPPGEGHVTCAASKTSGVCAAAPNAWPLAAGTVDFEDDGL